MAVRKPLYVASGNLREMDTTMVGEIVDQAVYQYSLSPSVALSVVGSSGSLAAINDTRNLLVLNQQVQVHFQVKEQHRNHKR